MTTSRAASYLSPDIVAQDGYLNMYYPVTHPEWNRRARNSAFNEELARCVLLCQGHKR